MDTAFGSVPVVQREHSPASECGTAVHVKSSTKGEPVLGQEVEVLAHHDMVFTSVRRDCRQRVPGDEVRVEPQQRSDVRLEIDGR